MSWGSPLAALQAANLASRAGQANPVLVYARIRIAGKVMRNRVVLRVFFIACCMALLVGCSGGGNGSNSSQASRPAQTTGRTESVKVTITDKSIASSLTTFVANRPYYFTVTNLGHAPYNFIIRVRPGQAVLNPTAQQGVLYILPSSQLPPGATKSFTYAFPDYTIQPAQSQGNSDTVQFTRQLHGIRAGQAVISVKVTRG